MIAYTLEEALTQLRGVVAEAEAKARALDGSAEFVVGYLSKRIPYIATDIEIITRGPEGLDVAGEQAGEGVAGE